MKTLKRGWVVDSFGNRWPANYDLCPECKQPDNCGDCNHAPLTAGDVLYLGGQPADTEGNPALPHQT